MTYFNLNTKPCPFCAEIIQSRAVKCRFCGEFLNTAKARALEAEAEAAAESPPSEAGQIDDGVLFSGRPSLFGMIPMLIKALILLVIMWLVVKYPLESIVNNLIGSRLTIDQVLIIGRYREIIGWALGGIIIFGILFKAFYLKMIYYEVCADRIEWGRGILDRRGGAS